MRLNELTKTICLRKFDFFFVERISSYYVVATLAKHGIQCLPCSSTELPIPITL